MYCVVLRCVVVCLEEAEIVEIGAPPRGRRSEHEHSGNVEESVYIAEC